MKLSLRLLMIVLALNVHAEPTPPGTTPAGNSFTYYYLNGDPVPPGTTTFLSLAGTAQLVNPDGSTGDSIYKTKEDAVTASKVTPDCSGVVFGPGPGGIPARCPGSSNMAASGTSTPVDDKKYDKASFELSTLLFSSSEIGAKSCRPAGFKMPGSLSSWWSAIKSYSTGEVAIDNKLNENVSDLQKKIQDMTTKNTQSKEMQTEATNLQIEIVNASIESLNGASGRFR